MSNLNQPSFLGKNQIDSQLFVNCTFDMDYLEVTKNESLRKYEENVFLLGTIFSSSAEVDARNKIDLAPSDDEMDYDSEEDNESSDSNSDSEILDDLLLNSCADNDMEKLKILIDKLSDVDNPQENLQTSFKEKSLSEKLIKSYSELKEHQNLLNSTKNSFKEDFDKFNELNQKLKSNKTSETDTYCNDILQQTYELGILSESYKQIDNFLRVKEKPSINHELPFDPSNNIIIMPL